MLQSSPVQPTMQLHNPVIVSHLPRPAQFKGHFRGAEAKLPINQSIKDNESLLPISHVAPLYPKLQMHFPDTHCPLPLQSEGMQSTIPEY